MTGSPPVQFITVSPPTPTTFRGGSFRGPGPRHHYIPMHLYTDYARVTSRNRDAECKFHRPSFGKGSINKMDLTVSFCGVFSGNPSVEVKF